MVRIDKKAFLDAYGDPTKTDRKIGFYNGKAKAFHKNPTSVQGKQAAKHPASVSHLMYDLRHAIKNEGSNKEKSKLVAAAKQAYAQEHKSYGCIRKIAYCIKNLFKGRGFHDEKYFYHQILKVPVGASSSNGGFKPVFPTVHTDDKSSSTSESSTTSTSPSPMTLPPKPKPNTAPKPKTPPKPDPISDISSSSTEELDVGTKDAYEAYFEAAAKACAKTVEEEKSGAFRILSDDNFNVLEAFDQLPAEITVEVAQVWNELIEAFKKDKYLMKYGQHQGLLSRHKIEMGKKVPEYFATVNQGGQSVWERKLLSLCGLRNLQHFGPTILQDMQETKFLDGAKHYGQKSDTKPGKGCNAFHFYTGTHIDLYEIITPKNDAQALDMAREHILKFGKQCGIKANSAQEVQIKMPGRNLKFEKDHYSKKEIVHDVGQSHQDRGEYGIWKRTDPQDSSKVYYYVNTPDVQVLIPVIVQFPYMVAEMALADKKKNNGKFSEKFLDEFFENINTGCFNQKFQAFAGLYAEWDSKRKNDPEVILKENIAKGVYGPAIKAKGYETVRKEAKSRQDIMGLLTGTEEVNDYTDKHELLENETYPEWVERNQDFFREFLKQKGLYEKILYYVDQNSGYFLLNEKAFKEILLDYAQAMVF